MTDIATLRDWVTLLLEMVSAPGLVLFTWIAATSDYVKPFVKDAWRNTLLKLGITRGKTWERVTCGNCGHVRYHLTRPEAVEELV